MPIRQSGGPLADMVGYVEPATWWWAMLLGSCVRDSGGRVVQVLDKH